MPKKSIVNRSDTNSAAGLPTQLHLPEYAAKRLLTSESTLAKWRSAGIGPNFVRISGGRVAYEEGELDRFIASRRVATNDSGAAA